jgi:hypothetical protein
MADSGQKRTWRRQVLGNETPEHWPRGFVWIVSLIGGTKDFSIIEI